MKPKSAHRFLLVLLLFRLFLGQMMDTFIDIFNISDKNLFIFSSIYSQVIGFGIPILIYFSLNRSSFKKDVFSREIGMINSLFIIAFTLLLQPITSLLSAIPVYLFDLPNNISTLLQGGATIHPAVLIVSTALFPAIFEELVFRGIVLSKYRKESMLTLYVMNGLLFAIIHQDAQQFLYTFALGCFFTFLVCTTRSIYSSILAHLTFNGIQLLLFISVNNKPPLQSAQAISELSWLSAILYLLFISLVALLILVTVCKRFIRFNAVRNEVYDLYDSEVNNLFIPTTDKKNFIDVFDTELVLIVLLYILTLL